jgi:hypothetical protein
MPAEAGMARAEPQWDFVPREASTKAGVVIVIFIFDSPAGAIRQSRIARQIAPDYCVLPGEHRFQASTESKKSVVSGAAVSLM